MQLDHAIRELTNLRKLLPPETEIRIAKDDHWYDWSDIMFSEVLKQSELIHTCDEAECICTEEQCGMDQHFESTGTCPLCDCLGCAYEPEDPEIYLTLGDQHSYALPHLMTETELREVYNG